MFSSTVAAILVDAAGGCVRIARNIQINDAYLEDYLLTFLAFPHSQKGAFSGQSQPLTSLLSLERNRVRY